MVPALEQHLSEQHVPVIEKDLAEQQLSGEHVILEQHLSEQHVANT